MVRCRGQRPGCALVRRSVRRRVSILRGLRSSRRRFPEFRRFRRARRRDRDARESGEEWYAAECFRCEGACSVEYIDGNSFGLAEFDLCSVDSVCSSVDLHPRQHGEDVSRGDGHHPRCGFCGTGEVTGNGGGDAALQEVAVVLLAASMASLGLISWLDNRRQRNAR